MVTKFTLRKVLSRKQAGKTAGGQKREDGSSQDSGWKMTGALREGVAGAGVGLLDLEIQKVDLSRPLPHSILPGTL